MKEIVILSGKGGTGKTTIVASFAALAKNKFLVDCDVGSRHQPIVTMSRTSLRQLSFTLLAGSPI